MVRDRHPGPLNAWLERTERAFSIRSGRPQAHSRIKGEVGPLRAIPSGSLELL